MPRTLDDKLQNISANRREKIQQRANELIAEEMALRDLRKALNQTQKALSKKLGIEQEGVSRLENRSDMLISTLTKYISAMGGTLSLTAEFPDRPPIKIKSFHDIHSN
ncbi:TPA: helix-turn-helix domain-containing protein [Legionella pneumophila subsp. pneumophila]|nr:helix-turn-helix domain-containing protein [Legionella pneumophila subsp. pneumophila]